MGILVSPCLIINWQSIYFSLGKYLILDIAAAQLKIGSVAINRTSPLAGNRALGEIF